MSRESENTFGVYESGREDADDRETALLKHGHDGVAEKPRQPVRGRPNKRRLPENSAAT